MSIRKSFGSFSFGAAVVVVIGLLLGGGGCAQPESLPDERPEGANWRAWSPDSVTIEVTNEGFVPDSVTIRRGGTVAYKMKADRYVAVGICVQGVFAKKTLRVMMEKDDFVSLGIPKKAKIGDEWSVTRMGPEGWCGARGSDTLRLRVLTPTDSVYYYAPMMTPTGEGGGKVGGP